MGAKQTTDTDRAIAAQLHLRRLELGLTQAELAESLGLSPQQVQKYESGSDRIGAARLSETARLLGVPISFFFPDDGAPDANVLETDAAALLRYYCRIKTPALKRAVVEVARSFAAEEERGGVLG